MHFDGCLVEEIHLDVVNELFRNSDIVGKDFLDDASWMFKYNIHIVRKVCRKISMKVQHR